MLHCNKVKNTIYGYESPYGLELLSTVHWSVKHDNISSNNVPAIIRSIRKWNNRKAMIMKKEHVEKAHSRLLNQNWF